MANGPGDVMQTGWTRGPEAGKAAGATTTTWPHRRGAGEEKRHSPPPGGPWARAGGRRRDGAAAVGGWGPGWSDGADPEAAGPAKDAAWLPLTRLPAGVRGAQEAHVGRPQANH